MEHLNGLKNISLKLTSKKYLMYLMDPRKTDLDSYWLRADLPSKDQMFRLHNGPKNVSATPDSRTSEKNSLPQGLEGLLQNLCVELIHNAKDEDISIRVYSNNLQTFTDPLVWKEFTCVRMEVSFMKPGADYLTHLRVVQAKHPCGIVHCPCGQASLCATATLCPYDQLISGLQRREDEPYTCLRMLASITLFQKQEPLSSMHLRHLSTASLAQLGHKILNHGLHCDFKLRLGEVTYPCHQSVLAGHSEVFGAMLEPGTAVEELVVDDMSVEGLEAFLKFLYCGDMEAGVSEPGMALELLRAGTKYEIEYLEMMCREILLRFESDKFTPLIALQMFQISGKVDKLFWLEERALKIIKENADRFTTSQEFADMLEGDLAMALQLIRRLAS